MFAFEKVSYNKSVSNSILEPLGIHGWEKVEDVLLGCVLLGEPALLVSQPGAAKTFFGEVLSKALDSPEAPCKYGYYDTSKTNFEDFIGFPNPEAFRQGKAEFIHNELTIWDKNVIMLDEISRASRDTSNKWLEVTGSRMLMGRPLPLVAVLGAMNPVDHHATHVLDQAFADRFVAFIPLPEFHSMENTVQETILSGQTGLDAPSLQFWQDRTIQTHQYVKQSPEFEQGAEQLRNLLSNAAQSYKELSADTVKNVENYVLSLQRSLAETGLKLEARRLKMIKRVLLATYVVRSKKTPQASLPEVCKDTISMLFPQPYTGSQLSKSHLQAAHLQACYALGGEENQTTKILSLPHHQRFLKVLTEQEIGLALRERIISDLETDRGSNAYMTAMTLLSLTNCSQATEVLHPALWSRIASKAQIQVEATNVTQDQKEFFEIQSSADVMQQFALAYALKYKNSKENWKELFDEALGHAQQAKETLLPVYASWQK